MRQQRNPSATYAPFDADVLSPFDGWGTACAVDVDAANWQCACRSATPFFARAVQPCLGFLACSAIRRQYFFFHLRAGALPESLQPRAIGASGRRFRSFRTGGCDPHSNVTCSAQTSLTPGPQAPAGTLQHSNAGSGGVATIWHPTAEVACVLIRHG